MSLLIVPFYDNHLYLGSWTTFIQRNRLALPLCHYQKICKIVTSTTIRCAERYVCSYSFVCVSVFECVYRARFLQFCFFCFFIKLLFFSFLCCRCCYRELVVLIAMSQQHWGMNVYVLNGQKDNVFNKIVLNDIW